MSFCEEEQLGLSSMFIEKTLIYFFWLLLVWFLVKLYVAMVTGETTLFELQNVKSKNFIFQEYSLYFSLNSILQKQCSSPFLSNERSQECKSAQLGANFK